MAEILIYWSHLSTDSADTKSEVLHSVHHIGIGNRNNIRFCNDNSDNGDGTYGFDGNYSNRRITGTDFSISVSTTNCPVSVTTGNNVSSSGNDTNNSNSGSSPSTDGNRSRTVIITAAFIPVLIRRCEMILERTVYSIN